MKTKFTLLIAAGLLFTVATKAQNFSSKKYVVNYSANSAATMNRAGAFDKREMYSFSDRRERRYYREERRHHRRHHHHDDWRYRRY